MKDKISVNVACYSKSRQDWLDETIASIRSQGLEPAAIPDERNTAIKWDEAVENCKTLYLHLAQHEEIYLPGFYEATVGYLDAHPEASAVFTMDYIVNEKGNRIGQTELPFPPQDSYDYAFVFNNMARYGNFLRCPSVVLRVDKVRGLTRPDAECDSASDTAFWYQCLLRGPIGIIPKKLYKYRQHSQSDTQAHVLGTDRQHDHLRAMRYALNHHPDHTKIDWDMMITVSKQIKRLEEMDEEKRLQAKAADAQDIGFIVVHESPFNAGTGILAGHRVCCRNRGDDKSIVYYVYPVEGNKMSIGVERGCPVVKCPPYAFDQVVEKVRPTYIEFHHTLRWPLDILRKREGIRQELFLHDAHLFCARYHLVNQHNEVCDGPNEAKCYRCTGISPIDYQTRHADLMRLLPGLDAIHANSEYTRSMVPKDYPPVDVHEFEIPPLPEFKRRKRSGYFGYFNMTKGVHVLLQAMLALPDVQLLMFCDVPEDLRDGKGIYGFDNILVVGAYQRGDLPSLSNLIDAAVVPSINESFGITARELRLQGLPVVATKVGGMAVLGCVDAANPNALVNAIREALSA